MKKHGFSISPKTERAISKTLAIVIVLVIIIAAAGAYFFLVHKTSTPTLNTSTLTDIAQVAAPDSLDPATGFYTQDGPLFTAVYQELVEFNGSDYHSVVPVLAQNFTEENDYNSFVFNMRPYATFSNGMPVNASDVWFSLYRTILMGQGVGVSNYVGLLFNSTQYSIYGIALPWGVCDAIQNVTGIHTEGNVNLTAKILSQILSNFNPSNSTIMKIMEYPDQAVVVLGNDKVEVNLLPGVHYKFFLTDMAAWWGAIVYPGYIDAHGGVQYNQQNDYVNLHGAIGSGPYVISSVQTGFSTITLKANPNYWGNGHNVPAPAQPAKIPNIVIYYGLSHTDRLEEFDKNQAQISYVSVPSITQMESGYYNSSASSSILDNLGVTPGVFYISMNEQVFPTNITDFRLALEHAVNYTALLDLYSSNGQILAKEFLGPISPTFPGYYNPNNLPMYSYNINEAIHYLQMAGEQGHFYVTLPNGTKIGDTSGSALPTLDIYTLSPVPEITQEELTLVKTELSQIGISVSIQAVAASVTDNWDSASSTPALVQLGWVPDWPDPVAQQLIPLTDINDGGLSGDLAWMNVSTLTQMYTTLPFITNTTEQEHLVGVAYNITYNNAPYIWLPYPSTYYFVQPYIGGFTYNPYVGYFYNMMYYKYS
ncbi:ABC transporter substrate-binding protein [Sulfuracidifex tepidarius]|uniref:Solute-binding protein family 5 domain-containing protein n=1 Tax=Sulfuracidifex tepidarius TaxID=1294262 RepID=A0A510E298_9CREN|nr:ABC transporter substrate-binding protein [Sulfuracidifex tepidarius]BBG23446.1 hypothetical protein IC006_0730 [Sulfuracidifex tepidarius]BBG26198.1 hypothetical protein IC007_0703 [Sulfuracidifex tepidarius]